MKRLAITGCVAIGTVGALAAAMSGATAKEKASGNNERDLVVTLVTPTNNQEVLPDLSDPGLNGVITVRFSSPLKVNDIIDSQNSINRLRNNVEFLSSDFQRLPGTPSVRKHIFTFSPLSPTTPVLAQGQYMLNFKSSIRNTRGRPLNNGLEDFTTTFSVGTDVYAPVLRKVSPIHNQTQIGLFQPITASFNEPISLNNLATTVFVQDASTNPPSAIPGLGGTGVTLERNGFDLVFTPDPCFGYPPKTNIQFILQGTNPVSHQTFTTPPGPFPVVTTTVEDVFQNKFERDLSLRWQVDPVNPNLFHSPLGSFDETNGQFKMVFQSKGTIAPPVGLRPGSNKYTTGTYGPPTGSPCGALLWLAPSCYQSGNMVLYTTDSGLGELDLRAYITRFNQGITDYSLVSVLPNAPVRLGRPAGLVMDPRVIPPLAANPALHHFHTFYYMVDERTGTVAVVRSDNLRVLGRLSGFQSPRDVTISTNPQHTSTTLYVSNFGSNQVTGVDLEGIKVSLSGQPGAQSPCEAIKDNQSNRATIQVGAGPSDISADSYLTQRVMVCNTLDDSITMIDPRTNTVVGTYDVGSNPVSGDWNTFNFGQWKMALVANQGGLVDPQGSVSLYFNSPSLGGGFFGAAQTRDGVESTLTDGIRNPTHVWGNISWITPPPPFNPPLTSAPVYWYISNTGGNTVVDLRLLITGLFGVSVTPQTNATVNVGLNPTSTVPDAFYPLSKTFTSVVGTGSVAIYDSTRSIPAVLVRVPGVRRLFTCYSN